METITRALHTAEERIWGSPPTEREPSDQEPVSGVKGEGTATDPYDAGNATGMLLSNSCGNLPYTAPALLRRNNKINQRA
jgi:hypothetical protein